MRRRALATCSGVAVYATVAAWAVACRPGPQVIPEATLALTDVHVVDSRDGSVARNVTVVVAGDEVLVVGPVDRRRLPEDAALIDGDGGYVIPGLWDMHTHSVSDPDDAVARALPLLIANGVTGIRDLGSTVPGLVETRRRLAKDPARVAPRIVAAGPLLDGVKLRWYGDLPLVLKTAADVERELPRLEESGVDLFKVYDQLPRPAYEAVVAWAERRGIPVVGHPPRAIGLRGAAEAGQRSLEHLSVASLRECVSEPEGWFDEWLGAKFQEGYEAYYALTLELLGTLDLQTCDAAFAAMAEAGTFFTPTLVMELNDRSRVDEEALVYLSPRARSWCETVLTGTDGVPPETREKMYAGHIGLLERMRAAGVTLLAGSDTQNNCLVPGHSLHWELERLVESGLSPLEALQAATVNAAHALGQEARHGRVAPGFVADLVVLRANPLEDVRRTQDIAGVLIRGRWLGPADLSRLRADAADAIAREPAG